MVVKLSQVFCVKVKVSHNPTTLRDDSRLLFCVFVACPPAKTGCKFSGQKRPLVILSDRQHLAAIIITIWGKDTVQIMDE